MFNYNDFMRNNVGVLLPVSALPANHGIGDFGSNAITFINWLSKHHYRYWQILPVNPVGFGYSPYNSTCTLAIDIRYISLDSLVKCGLLSSVPTYRDQSPFVNYEKVYEFKLEYLKKAYVNYLKGKQDALKKFKTRHHWVMKYATYVVLKSKHDNKPWYLWNDEYVDYFEDHNNPPKRYLEEIDFVIFCQYIAYNQYRRILSYARSKDVKIISDVPFYVGSDSVECWTHKREFLIDKNNHFTHVGGVPPDYFSETGQLWGCPIYNFDRMKLNNYQLLVDRVGYLGTMCDIVRLDHFRAFDTYYVIPGDAKDAKNGEWKIGPREDFFKCLYEKYPDTKLIAEDLGLLVPSVYELRDKLNLPGMYVTQFMIFDKINTSNLVVYSGTHDNETISGWLKSMSDQQREKLRNKFRCRDRDLYHRVMKYTLSLPSKITIIPLQDIIMLDNKARINTPSTVGFPNFTWRMKNFELLNRSKFKIK